MKKIYFPRIIAPIGSSLSLLIDTAISFSVLVFIMVISYFLNGFVPSIRMLLLPFAILLPILLGFSAGLFLSPLNIKYRDLNQAIPFLLTIGQYVTPVAYSFLLPATQCPNR